MFQFLQISHLLYVMLVFLVIKSHNLPFVATNSVYSAPLELVVVDLWGLAPYYSSGYQYYISFVYAFSWHTLIYFLRKKSNALQMFLTFKTHVELQLGVKIKQLQTDGGGDFRTFD